jgi:ribonuclease G
MSTELIINASLPETRIALMEEGEIQDLLIERASEKGIVGNIYKGRVTRVLPGMQAAFVDIGLEKAAFLYVDDVYVHSKIWDDEEGNTPEEMTEGSAEGSAEGSSEAGEEAPVEGAEAAPSPETGEASTAQDESAEAAMEESMDDEEGEESDDDDEPVAMGPGDEDEGAGNRVVSPPPTPAASSPSEGASASAQPAEGGAAGPAAPGERSFANRRPRHPHKRGRRGGRGGGGRHPSGGRDRERFQARDPKQQQQQEPNHDQFPQGFNDQVQDRGQSGSDRLDLAKSEGQKSGQPVETQAEGQGGTGGSQQARNSAFRQQRGRDRRVRSKSSRPFRPQVDIQNLLKEGQEVIVQVAKDPIATKGARLTCHISLPGRHLVCMPTIDHVGVSRRIERDDERRRLREFVDQHRPKGVGFIVRTASGRQSENQVKQDIEYLSSIWEEIRLKANEVSAPAMIYEDLNSVLRVIRDWVTEDIDKVIVDSRYHYNDILKFVSRFMPALKQKVELYHGDIPIFDAYGISSELSRALERKVWLKSGGYIVIDQAEALVAIDVNTGRYVGKKSLEDTILKTNLEAVQEIAYQLRLRNCGGIIILDLIDMEKEENRHRVFRALEDALRKDRARPTIAKFSDLGLVEMTRKRTRDTIIRTLCESCAHCEAKGFIKSKQTVAYEVLREIERAGTGRDIGKVLVQAHQDVIDILAIEERETLDMLERRHQMQVYLQAVTDYHPEQFEVSGDKATGQRDSREGRRPQHQNRNSRDNRSRQNNTQREAPAQEPRVRPNPPSPQTETAPPPSEGTDRDQESNPAPEPGTSPGGDFVDEEDRLAFLRAQAAQDAALAMRGSAAENASPSQRPRTNTGDRSGGRPNNRGGRNNNRGGRNNNRGGRGGGRFHRNDRNAGGQYYENRGASAPARNPQPQQEAPQTAAVPSTNNDEGGSRDEGGGYSQPPV